MRYRDTFLVREMRVIFSKLELVVMNGKTKGKKKVEEKENFILCNLTIVELLL